MNCAILKKFFAGFVHSRAIARHFRRVAQLDAVAVTAGNEAGAEMQ